MSWAVLLPLNSVKMSVSGFSEGIYRFTFDNIDTSKGHNQYWYIVLLVLIWIFTSKFHA